MSKSHFNNLVEVTCIQYASQLNGAVTDQPNCMAEGRSFRPLSSEGNDQPALGWVADDVIQTAVYLIATSSKLEKYIYGVVSWSPGQIPSCAIQR